MTAINAETLSQREALHLLRHILPLINAQGVDRLAEGTDYGDVEFALSTLESLFKRSDQSQEDSDLSQEQLATVGLLHAIIGLCDHTGLFSTVKGSLGEDADKLRLERGLSAFEHLAEEEGVAFL